jgi:hypothetical protein
LSRGTTRALSVAAALAAAATLAAQASAGVRTTEPQKLYKKSIVLSDTRIAFTYPRVGRGALILFTVRNGGKTPRDFFIGGTLIRRLAPGRTKSFQLQFLARGKYPYWSLGHPGTKITGTLVVT